MLLAVYRHFFMTERKKTITAKHTKKSLKNLEVTIIIRNFARSMKLFSTYWWWRTQDFKKS